MAIVNDDTAKKIPITSMISKIFSWKYLDKISFFAIVILLMFSIVFVYSASIYDSINDGGSPYSTAMKQAIFAIVGLIMYFFVLKIPIKTYKKLLTPIVLVVIVLMILPFVIGDARNGAHRWIPIAGDLFTIQPAEIAKLVIILIWSQALSTRVNDFKVRWNYLKQKKAPLERFLKRIWLSWRMPIVFTIILFVLYYFQSDNGSLVISAGLIAMIIFASGALPNQANRVFLGLVILGVLAIFGIYIYINGLSQETIMNIGDKTSDQYNYIIGRFISWVDPFLTYSGAGYQLSNSLIAIANGGFFGRGIGNGLQKQGFLSEGHNDFIVANIVEEIGIFGIMIIYTLYVTIISRGYKIAREARNSFSSLMAFGIATLFFFQAFWNSGGIIGLLPLKGLTAPLLSYGGSSLMIMLFSLAVLQRINIENNVKRARMQREKENAE